MNWKKILQSEKDQLISDLDKLLQIPSIKNVNESEEGKPFGIEIANALNFMLELGAKEGFRVKNLNGYAGYIEYGPEDAEDYIAVLCHIDVVPPTGDWTNDPFVPLIKDGKIIARGAIDDKGPTMAAFYALKKIKDSGLQMKHRIRIIIGTDEESGMNCMKTYQKMEPPALFGFAPDAGFPIINAEKGQINALLKLTSEIQESNVHLVEFIAGNRGNMVPDKATAILSGKEATNWIEKIKNQATKRQLTCKIEQKSNQWKITVLGKSAHGASPFEGVNAAFQLAELLQEIPLAPSEKNYISFISEVLSNDFFGEKLSIDFEDDITGKLTVNAGIFKFQNESSGTISLNIRCPIQTPYLRTIEKLEMKSNKYHFQLEEVREKQPHYVEESHPGIMILQNAYENQTGQKADLLAIGGATYARFLENGVAFGALFPGKESTAHHVDEYAEIEDLCLAASIYAESLFYLGNM